MEKAIEDFHNYFKYISREFFDEAEHRERGIFMCRCSNMNQLMRGEGSIFYVEKDNMSKDLSNDARLRFNKDIDTYNKDDEVLVFLSIYIRNGDAAGITYKINREDYKDATPVKNKLIIKI